VKNIDKVLDAFISGDYFIIFLVLTLAILVVLILALIKAREEYKELLQLEEEKENKQQQLYPTLDNNINEKETLDGLESLMASTKEDLMDENKPLIKQIDIPNIKTYDDVIDEYESSEEENAVISADELELRTRQRMNDLGINENQVTIAKYEEEQEKKAIISYEQLLKNASNITLSYKEESKKNRKDKDAPRVNKIEIEQKEVVGAEIYLEEEEFLKILKDFRASLNENIFN